MHQTFTPAQQFQTLADSMDVHPGSTHGHVMAGKEDEIRIEYSGTRGSLYNALEMVRALERTKLIEGNVPDMEAMLYTTSPGKPFAVGKNVEIRVNAEERFELAFTTKLPADEVSARLGEAIAAEKKNVANGMSRVRETLGDISGNMDAKGRSALLQQAAEALGLEVLVRGEARDGRRK